MRQKHSINGPLKLCNWTVTPSVSDNMSTLADTRMDVEAAPYSTIISTLAAAADTTHPLKANSYV